MIQIRGNVFETNSSSTHSLTIVSKSDYEAWQNNNDILLHADYDDLFVPRETVIERVRAIDEKHAGVPNYNPLRDYYEENYIYDGYKYQNIDDVPEDLVDPYLAGHGYYTVETYGDDCGMHYYSQEYTSEHGDELVAFGYYGCDY